MPDIGKTSTGGANSGNFTPYAYITHDTMPADGGDIASVSIRLAQAPPLNGKIRPAVWTNSAGAPTTLLRQGPEVLLPASTGLYTLPLDSPLTVAGLVVVHFGMWFGNDDGNISYDAAVSGTSHFVSLSPYSTAGTIPSAAGASADNKAYDLFATYTTAAGAIGILNATRAATQRAASW